MAKKNIITYYNNGQVLSTSVLKQPPDMLLDATLQETTRIILQMHQRIPSDAKVVITQGDTVIRSYSYNLSKHIKASFEPP